MKKNIDGNEFEVDNKGFETWKNMTLEVLVCFGTFSCFYLSFWLYFFKSHIAS